MNTKMTRYTSIAQRIDAHHLRLIQNGVTDPHQIFNQMMAFLPELHELWTGTTDHELFLLSSEYPYFKNFCVIVEELSAAEGAKVAREYDGQQKFSADQQKIAAKILGDIACIHENVLEMKNLGIGADNEIVQDARVTLEEWMSGATGFKEQLVSEGFHEYGIKTWDTVITENYDRVKGLLGGLRK